MRPLVSIIATAFNHESYVAQSLRSVFDQNYDHWELIIVDDCSSDNTREAIEELLAVSGVNAKVVFNDSNLGVCAAFNLGLKQASGDYIVDFSTDDVLEPFFITEMLETFVRCGENVGVVYGNSVKFNETGYRSEPYFKLNFQPPQGDVFTDVVERHMFDPVAMMSKREVFETTGPHDESLAYEDFDFVVRAARSYDFGFCGKVLAKRREVAGSLSKKFSDAKSAMLHSTLAVCEKIEKICQTKSEQEALGIRIKYEATSAWRLGRKDLVKKYVELASRIGAKRLRVTLLGLLS